MFLAIVDTRSSSHDAPQQGEVIAGQTALCLLCRLGCVVEHSGTDISHTLSFYFPDVIGLVQRIVRFVMRTEPKASYRTVQYEYVYRYTPNIYIYIHEKMQERSIWEPVKTIYHYFHRTSPKGHSIVVFVLFLLVPVACKWQAERYTSELLSGNICFSLSCRCRSADPHHWICFQLGATFQTRVSRPYAKLSFCMSLFS